MTRRDFLMKIAAGLTTAIVVRPSVLWNPTPKQIEFLNSGERLFVIGPPYRSGYVYLHPTQYGEYIKMLGEIVIDNPSQCGLIKNIERSDKPLFRRR